MSGTARVSLVKGGSRRENTRKSLELIDGDIKRGLGSRRLLIKPNFVSASIQLAATHIDHIRGLLDFFTGVYRGKAVIAEASAGDTERGFRNFGYYRLLDEYDIELLDLNRGPFETVALEDSAGRPVEVKVAGMLMDRANYIVSAARLKTHDAVVVTLSVKNMAMGCVRVLDKAKAHQGVRRTNLNIARLAGAAWPDLAAIDGFEGMEGEGPILGDPVPLGMAIASTDALAADRVACEVMGVDFFRVGYLSHCASAGRGEADIGRIEVVGSPLNDCIRPFRPHSGVEEQYRWK
jgi:uncharacterized protein (DUF362 family)